MTIKRIDGRTCGGFTLVELLVSIFIVTILISLLLIGVQAAREASRKTSCLGNLGQLGIAVQNYLSSYGSYPGGHNGIGYSIHAVILPYLDQNSLYNSINLSLPIRLDYIGWGNATAATTQLGIFSCPSDDAPPPGLVAGTNYAGSRGVERRDQSDNGFFSFYSPKPTSPQDVADGTSSTAALAEWVTGPRSFGRRDARGSIFEVTGELAGPAEFDSFVKACSDLNFNTATINSNLKGDMWLYGGYSHTLYNHVMNINEYNCINQGFVQEAAYTAGSRHRGGAYVSFGDGHVRFVSDTIALMVWRALGTRNGSEVISMDNL